jgi:hypothetical protein
MKKLPLQVYLDDRDRKLLDQLATREGLSMAETVRVALRRWAIDETQGEDPVLALIGTMEAPDVPADLSTRNDEYAVFGMAGAAARRVAEPRPGRP